MLEMYLFIYTECVYVIIICHLGNITLDIGAYLSYITFPSCETSKRFLLTYLQSKIINIQIINF